MLRRSVHRREGMTLVELLVVIGIVVTLMALLVGAVMKALDVLPRTDTTARITTSTSAANTFGANGSFGGTRYPVPAGRFDKSTGAWVGGFRLRNSYPVGGDPGMDSFEAQYIVEVFGVRPTSVGGGPVQINDLGWTGSTLNAELDANQTFTFFLTGIPELNADGTASFTGFSSDPQRPFARRASATETRKGPVLDLTGKQKYTFVIPGVTTGNGFAWLVDGYSYRAPDGTMAPGRPYAYFATYKGQRNKYGGYNPLFPGVLPYKRTGSATGDFENATGFQLISGGKDGTIGTGGNWSSVTPAGMDDQSNFSTSLLGAGPQ